jgi:hypothetical protein
MSSLHVKWLAGYGFQFLIHNVREPGDLGVRHWTLLNLILHQSCVDFSTHRLDPSPVPKIEQFWGL